MIAKLPYGIHCMLFQVGCESRNQPHIRLRIRHKTNGGILKQHAIRSWQTPEQMYALLLDLIKRRNEWLMTYYPWAYAKYRDEYVPTQDEFVAYMYQRQEFDMSVEDEYVPERTYKSIEDHQFHPSVYKAREMVAQILERYGVGS